MKHFFLAFLIVLFVSCSLGESNGLILKPDYNIKFQSSLAFYPNDSGYFKDSGTGEAYFYFCNQATERQIEIFDLKGELVKIISISEALNKVGEPISLSVISMDTILISPFYTNEIVALNSEGQMWFYLDIEEILPEKEKGMYEFWLYPQTTFSCKRQNLYFKVLPRFDKIVYAHNANDLSLEEQNFLYFKEYYNSPYFFKLSNYFSELPSFEFGLNDIYHNICTESSSFSEYPKYRYINDKLVFYSIYSSSIFIINPDTFIIEKTIDLSSEYTTIGCPAAILTKGKMFEQMEKADDEIKKSGRIISVLYDNDKYYIVVKHRDLIPTILNKSSILSFFSVIVLNNDFVMEDEFLFNSKKYNKYSGLITNQGLTFQKLVSDEKKVYSVFNL